jgi:uncharacterized protein
MSKSTIAKIALLVAAHLGFIDHSAIAAITVNNPILQSPPSHITAQLASKPVGESDEAVFEDIVSGKVTKLRQFLDRGGNPNLYFHAAVNSGAIDCVKLMIDRGANINLAGDEGVTPLMTSVRVTYRNGLEITKLLVKRGAKINAQADRGITPLMYAAWSVADHYEDEYVNVVQFLIQHGAKVNIKNKMGDTPLSIAKGGNYRKIVATLKKAGAKH